MPALYQREKPTPFSRDDLILERLKDIKEGQRELDARIDKLDARIDKLDARIDKLDAKIDITRQELSNRIGSLENEVRNSVRHTQIMTATVVGVALAVIYFVFTH